MCCHLRIVSNRSCRKYTWIVRIQIVKTVRTKKRKEMRGKRSWSTWETSETEESWSWASEAKEHRSTLPEAEEKRLKFESPVKITESGLTSRALLNLIPDLSSWNPSSGIVNCFYNFTSPSLHQNLRHRRSKHVVSGGKREREREERLYTSYMELET